MSKIYTKSSVLSSESGNAVIIVLVALVIVAVGALAYFSGELIGGKTAREVPSKATAEIAAETTEEPAQDVADAEIGEAITVPPPPPQTEIKPGNPVVAKLNGQDITRLDVLKFVQTLPAETQQLPVNQLFPLALEQVINAKIITEKSKNVKLDDDPVVKQQLENAKQQIVRTVFLQKEVEKRMTEERLKEAYDVYTANFPEVQEARAKHILVDDEALAKELITKLDNGAVFEDLAKENSKDSSGANGGDIGYFAKTDVVPEFAEASFTMEIGSYTKEPVKSQFGYHVIQLEERRTRPIPSFEESKAFLTSQLRGAVLDKTIRDWRDGAKIERFDINGDALEAAGQEPAAGAE